MRHQWQACLVAWIGLCLLQSSAWGQAESGSGPAQQAKSLPTTLEQVRVIDTHEKEVSSVQFSPDGRMLASAGGETLGLWDVRTGKLVRERRFNGDPLWYAVYAAEGRILACSRSASKQIDFLDAQTLERKWQLRLPNYPLRLPMCPSARGNLIAVSARRGWDEYRILLYDVLSGNQVGQVQLGKKLLDNYSLSPDGAMLAVTLNEVEQPVRLYRVSDGKEMPQLNQQASDFAFAPSGEVLAVEAGSGVNLWNVPRGELIHEVSWRDLPSRRIYDEVRHIRLTGKGTLDFSPDGKTLVCRCNNAVVRFYEVATGGLRYEIDCDPASMSFSPDGRLLVVILHYQGTIHLYKSKPRLSKGGSQFGKEDMDRLCSALRSRDSATAYRAMLTLRDEPTSVAVLSRLIRIVPPVASGELEKLVAALDDDSYEVRERATQRLADLGEAVRETLRRSLEHHPSLELRRRATELLDRLEVVTEEQLVLLRVIEVLEAIGDDKVKQVLENLARGASGALATTEAKGALKRLALQQVRVP